MRRSTAVTVDELEREAPDALPVERERHRAKWLGLSREHVSIVAIATASARAESAPVRIRSGARARARERVAVLLTALMARANLTTGDVAAALDMSAQRVVEMRSGARPVHVEHALLLVERLPSMRAALLALLDAAARGDER